MKRSACLAALVLLLIAGVARAQTEALRIPPAIAADASISSVASPPPPPLGSPTPPAILLANVYGEHIDPTRYLVSEKLDGVRALWDGQVLRFRSGRVVDAPAWFLARLPAQALDGELWLGRGQFEALSGAVRKSPPLDADWAKLRYMVFEMPGQPGSFEQRVRQMRDLVQQTAWPQLAAVEQVRVTDRQTLKRMLSDTVRLGGEGLMLHLADAPYGTGRSDVLLKLKPFLDTEATVVGHRAGKGKYTGMLGALEMQTPEGRRFFLGSGLTDALRKNPPPVGTLITYRYRELTGGGLPRFASFLRVRVEP